MKRGEPLAYVSSPDFATAVADYRKAQTAYRNAKRIADRDSALFKNDALARGDLEQAQSDLAAADADVDAAVESMRALGVDEAQIEAVKDGKTSAIEAIVRAPIDGTVVEKLISDGQLLQAGSTRVLHDRRPEHDVGDGERLRERSARRLGRRAGRHSHRRAPRADAGQGRLHRVARRSGHEGRAGARASRRTRTTRCAATCSCACRSSRRREHRGILVPVSAVLRDDQNLPFVFVAAANNGFARRRIDLGTRVGDQYEVTSGLNAGDQVVAEGALFLQFAESQ